MSWEFLQTLSCPDLWEMRMYHRAITIGTKNPIHYPLPAGCICHQRGF